MLLFEVFAASVRIHRLLKRILSFIFICMTNLMYGQLHNYTSGAISGKEAQGMA